jgi:hypothetical protein
MKFINRKQVAEILNHMQVSPKMVERNEKRWGIDKFRVDLNTRVVQYREVDVRAQFVKLGFLQVKVS